MGKPVRPSGIDYSHLESLFPAGLSRTRMTSRKDPLYVCLICWVVQRPEREKVGHRFKRWCWVCAQTSDAFTQVWTKQDCCGFVSTVKRRNPVMKLGPAELAAYQLGGDDAVRVLVTGQSKEITAQALETCGAQTLKTSSASPTTESGSRSKKT